MKNRREICDKLGKSGLLCAMLLVNAGCVDKYLPDEKDAFDRNVAYTRDRKSTRLNSSHPPESRMPSSA